MDLTGMSRPEKFKYLKANDIKAKATMKTVELNRLLTELDAFQRGEIEEKPVGLKSVREGRERVPLGAHRQKLSIDHLHIPENKVARWVNDTPGRIGQAIEGGYMHVRSPQKETVGEDPLTTGNLGDSVNVVVGSNEDGSALTGYLMVIDKDLYDEDQAYKQAKLDELDKAIKEGQVEPSEGQYIPSGGIKVGVTN
jgi:hypothetical protein